jgi:hypothetical protein
MALISSLGYARKPPPAPRRQRPLFDLFQGAILGCPQLRMGRHPKTAPHRGGRDFSISGRQTLPYHGGNPGGPAAALNMKIRLILVALLNNGRRRLGRQLPGPLFHLRQRLRHHCTGGIIRRSTPHGDGHVPGCRGYGSPPRKVGEGLGAPAKSSPGRRRPCYLRSRDGRQDIARRILRARWAVPKRAQDGGGSE